MATSLHEWPNGWVPLTETESLLMYQELQREMCAGHALFGQAVVALARSEKNDDVLFQTKQTKPPFCIVHLTWRKETSPEYPWVIFFDNEEAFKMFCKMDESMFD